MKKIFLSVVCFCLVITAVSFADHISIGPAALSPQMDGYNFTKGALAEYLQMNVLVRAVFHGQVFLPQGAVVDGIYVFYKDNASGGILTVGLLRMNYDKGVAQTLFSVSTQGMDPNIRKTANWKLSSGQRTVKNESFTYHIYVLFDVGMVEDLRFYGVRIHYH